jgi:SAM-dependent methyltransferase
MTLDAGDLRSRVRDAYSAAAQRPGDEHPFPVGRQFAESVGYPPERLASIPARSLEAFTGVSNVSIFAALPEASTVLDLGCGAGLDSFIAARRVGSTGRVFGIDFSASMLERARRSASERDLPNLVFLQADAERLPIPSSSVDVALVNGIFNLNPFRDAIFLELGRTTRKGGEVYAAELILREPLPLGDKSGLSDWFS